MRFILAGAAAGEPIVDPMAGPLLSASRARRADMPDPAPFLALDSVFPPALAAHPSVRAAITRSWINLPDRLEP